MFQWSQDSSPNAPKLFILGAKLANIAPSWRQVDAHVRSSWALGRHLGPTWLHFGSLLALLFQHCGPRCRQDLQNHPQTLIFNDFWTDVGAFLKHFSNHVSSFLFYCVLCFSMSFYLFPLVTRYYIYIYIYIYTNISTYVRIYIYHKATRWVIGAWGWGVEPLCENLSPYVKT